MKVPNFQRIIIAVLLCGTAHAAQIDRVSTDFNFIGISGDDGEISSTLNCTAGLCTVFDELDFYQPFDGIVNLSWTRNDGSVILSGRIPYDFTLSGETNTTIGRRSSVTYAGFFLGKPNYSRLTGTADFTGSITINPPCFGFVCKEDYLELFVTIPNVFGIVAAPSGALSTQWELSDLTVPRGSPFGTLPDVIPLIDFSSTVDKVGSEFRYTYAITNSSDTPLDYALDQLGWSGTLDAHQSLEKEIFSLTPPGIVRNTGQALVGPGRELFASVDVLQPVVPQAVPEPQTIVLLGSGLGCAALALCLRSIFTNQVTS